MATQPSNRTLEDDGGPILKETIMIDLNQKSTGSEIDMSTTIMDIGMDEDVCKETNNVDIEDNNGEDETDNDEEYEVDTRFLAVCMDGDVDDLVHLLELMAQAGETLGMDMLNYADHTGRVSTKREI